MELRDPNVPCVRNHVVFPIASCGRGVGAVPSSIVVFVVVWFLPAAGQTGRRISAGSVSLGARRSNDSRFENRKAGNLVGVVKGRCLGLVLLRRTKAAIRAAISGVGRDLPGIVAGHREQVDDRVVLKSASDHPRGSVRGGEKGGDLSGCRYVDSASHHGTVLDEFVSRLRGVPKAVVEDGPGVLNLCSVIYREPTVPTARASKSRGVRGIAVTGCFEGIGGIEVQTHIEKDPPLVAGAYVLAFGPSLVPRHGDSSPFHPGQRAEKSEEFLFRRRKQCRRC
mmetsp:Transcript_8786/g.21451  ORF Transcript_8786/g.21451 Transcript_8786/m.21451 type:complete len:281 (+) Transcript_8786:1957-2799(+)